MISDEERERWADHCTDIFVGARFSESGATKVEDDAIVTAKLMDMLTETDMPEEVAEAFVHSVKSMIGILPAMIIAQGPEAAVNGISIAMFIIGFRLGRNPTPLDVPDTP